MLQIASSVPRMLPGARLPHYTFIPGTETPHPIRDPRGHSHNKKGPPPPALKPDTWSESRNYLFGIDLFNIGYYWEAHEEWERLWRASGPDSLCGRFLKGLVKMSAAGIKVRENSLHGVRRHAASAGEVFADIAAETGDDEFCGLELTSMQYAADRAAQLVYKTGLPIGVPLRVFPFLLEPQPTPFA